jgi:hypothetical protein
MSGFSETQILMIQMPVLQALYDADPVDIVADYSGLTPDQRARVHYCDTLLGLCETVWVGHRKGRLDVKEWPQWGRWLVTLHRAPEFRWTLAWVEGAYEPEFIRAIRSAVAEAGP